MKLTSLLGALALACALASAAAAQTVTVPGSGGTSVPAQSMAFGAKDAAATFVDAAHPLPVTQAAPPTGAATSALQATNGNKLDTLHTDNLARGASTFTESYGSMAASALVNGAARDMGAAAGPYAIFNCYVLTGGGGVTLYVQWSTDGSSFSNVDAGTSVGASTPKTISYPVIARYQRCVVVNGATPQSPVGASSYTAAR